MMCMGGRTGPVPPVLLTEAGRGMEMEEEAEDEDEEGDWRPGKELEDDEGGTEEGGKTCVKE